ncbi:SUMF1/EgtB/PvdO family nonheme iron enzyme [Candidatus Chloroploca sp. M-50]|uniref:SUMF1/EgtB/PvdO family nonheme iron enzyme n=1 Tax=Candidatus Chloroploca mongolica TaxID=2528176 RepID=A0ABS4DFW6_9CHLR|nr:SUMF1/EgtB/PvdO family nonheme iron enzyme [Candidatus Chloroploca mongolica]MBP1468316.1 SUMF1/EgtB/PvdO family nonheme iron enzyme [Candidatus Chloroploca mongolica]
MDTATAPTEDDARQMVERFVRRFDESYRLLACHAALPLILTPELVHNLRNTFLRGQVPWVAEVDLLLSELCRPVGYEQYAMDAAVRAYLINDLQARVGARRMQDVARLLIRYIHHLSRARSIFSDPELQAQQLAAMVCLDDQREEAVHTLVEALQKNLEAIADSPTATGTRAELTRLTRLAQTLAPQMEAYPALIAYADLIRRLLADPARTLTEEPTQVQISVTILGQTMPAPGGLLPPESRNSPDDRVTPARPGLALPPLYGRETELALLQQFCLEPVNHYVVLYGAPQSGKTSLLRHLEAALQQFAQVDVCRIDIQAIQGATTERAFAYLATQISQSLPAGVEATGVEEGTTFQSFLIEALDRDDINRFVLMLDEWGALPVATHEKLAHTVRSIFEMRSEIRALAKLQVIVSGGIELYDLGRSEASPLLNICEAIYLGDLSETEAVALMWEDLGSLDLPEKLVDDLASATYDRVGGHPYLTRRIAELVVQATPPGDPLAANALATALGEIEHGDPLLRRIIDDLRAYQLEDAARRLLSDPPPFTRLDDDMARLELIGLARPAGETWAPRNAWLAEVVGRVLDVASPTVVAPLDAGATTATPLPTWVPHLIHIPAGPFLMGSSAADGMAYADEKPQHTLMLPDYWIGKTPVTNAQFRPFVEGDGYTNPAYWTKESWAWREQEEIVTPRWWNDSTWNGAQHPVVGVSWFEAVAYCRWLSAQTGHEFRLPTEAEWEKAARGTDGRIWPWGNTWEHGRCNSEEAGHKRTTPVDQYPTGASPYGVLDMAGNVWEWCATKSGKSYPYQWEDEWQAAYLEADKVRRIRGGSWYSKKENVRASYRVSSIPRNLVISGLRVASHSPLPGSES